ncbi:hypothetical protein FHETE_3958 [Fusarium heterosporum]|uniref:chitinase n=1 Tax=Fusarium heterosporum TaxID=42747 RepID=A0A8H5TLT7_FUSHE|nr:hypothetical protein FHETE_3958 [Fusarium heterosporum]
MPAGCMSNCNAKSDCGKYAKKGNEKCPLNVCCSEHGYCGTTKDFCGAKCQNGCDEPKVPSGKSTRPVRDKVIGYYEAWSARRKCQPFRPSNIPTNALTHVNFAFAYIDPDTYEITTMDSSTLDTLFQEVTAIKSMKSGLGDPIEVWIAIGGWTFSNNHTDTQPLFGEIAKTEKNRKIFSDNLVKFMTRYGFDGVDLDWEYPGAPDRGGNGNEDTKNFVKLIKTMRQTFDKSPRGGYGLSFTIPSSYWYLRWFDVTGMLNAGALWVNLMSYDLHGVWDEKSQIGSLVQAHTNLTEIKQSMDLLWRNKVPPGKVVLGTGFYGRSFQLKDPSCDTPGCIFAGAAKKGPCTNEAGILGYFEIKNILKKDSKIETIHDKTAAVNYFKFDKDQWVSYDDKRTFQQKVKWADSIGLGGLMIWAVDLDDNDFTALSGLIGKPVSKGINKVPQVAFHSGESWSSDNGEDCRYTDCGDKCHDDEVFKFASDSNCGGSSKRHICCPRNRNPQKCQWRGGESGSACHGQCHEGELTMFYDRHGDRSCSSGQQVYCCTSDRYQKLVDGCELGDCGEDCPSGTYEVAQQTSRGTCGSKGGGKRPMCCKQKLSCHWVGKGQCDQSNCKNNDVQIQRSTKGDGSNHCGKGRSKSLCCNPPNDIDPFTPTDLENLFPDVPSPDDQVKYDLQLLGELGSGLEVVPGNVGEHHDPNSGAFGFVLIAGPKDSVSSFSKRDGSHIEILDCPSITESGRQTARIFCSNDDLDSNCDDVLEGGIDGTVVRMPDGCGPGSYVVAHSIMRSEDQRLPGHLVKRMPPGKEVMDFEFSYDFGLIKRGADDIYLRIDYSNMPGYWEEIVDRPGYVSKRSLHPRHLSQRDLLDKRFFSDNSQDWADAFNSIRLTSVHTRYKDSKDAVIVSKSLDKSLSAHLECKVGTSGYLDIRATTEYDVKSKIGVTMIGKLRPFNIEQAYGFVDVQYEIDSSVKVKGNLGIDTEYTVHDSKVDYNQMGLRFSHPGIVSITPSFDVRVGLEGKDAHFSGDFEAKMHAGSDTKEMIRQNTGFIRQTFPDVKGGNEGANHGWQETNDFVGHMQTDKGSVKLSLIPDFKLAMELEVGDSGEKKRDIHDFGSGGGSISGYMRDLYLNMNLMFDNTGVYMRQDPLRISFLGTGSTNITPWSSSETSGKNMGTEVIRVRLHKQTKGEKRKLPEEFDEAKNMVTEFGSGVLTCPVGKRGRPLCAASLCETDLLVCPPEDVTAAQRPSPETNDQAVAKRHENRSLSKPKSLNSEPSTQSLQQRDPVDYQGGQRDYYMKCYDQRGKRSWDVAYKSLEYPSVSDWAEDDERYDRAYHAEYPKDCASGAIKGHKVPLVADEKNDPVYCTEHIIELQTMARFTEHIADHKLPDGSEPSLPRIYCDFIRAIAKKDMIKGAPPSPGSKTSEERPITRIMQAHGWEENWEDFVFLEKAINGVKAQLWKGNNPVDQRKMLRKCRNEDKYSEALIAIRTVINVFNYMNNPEVHAAWINTANNIRSELKRADVAWMNLADMGSPPGVTKRPSTRIVDYWDLWIRSHLDSMVQRSSDFVEMSLEALEAFWTPRSATDPARADLVLDKCSTLRRQVSDITIDKRGLN